MKVNLTNISLTKELVIYARLMKLDTFKSITQFLTNVYALDDKSANFMTAVMNTLNQRNFSVHNVTGLGSDGATVMLSTIVEYQENLYDWTQSLSASTALQTGYSYVSPRQLMTLDIWKSSARCSPTYFNISISIQGEMKSGRPMKKYLVSHNLTKTSLRSSG